MPPTPKPPLPIGPNIRKIREMRGLTQLQLAHKAGYTGEDAGALISKIETGNQTPWVETLEKIAAALGVGMGKLLLPVKGDQ